jgi:TonB family protein
MRVWSFAAFAVLIAMIATPAGAASPFASPTSEDAPADAQSSKDFATQIDAIIHTYRAGNKVKGRQLIEQFRLPKAEAWFAEHLNPARSAEFTERYELHYTRFADALEQTIEDVVSNHGAELETKLTLGADQSPKNDLTPSIRRSGVVSTKPVDLFFCLFEITLKKQLNSGWGQTFTREDGSFRFLGFGGWPFWVWQRGTEAGPPKYGYFIPPTVLVSQVEPIYPPQAKADKVQGIVLVRAHVDTEGRVVKAEVLSGDPLLAQAALDAVQQWRYKPVVRGGVPVEIDRTAKVVFVLH